MQISDVDAFVKKITCIQPLQDAQRKLDQFIAQIDRTAYLNVFQDELKVHLKPDMVDIKEQLRRPMNIDGKCPCRFPIARATAKVKYHGGKVGGLNIVEAQKKFTFATEFMGWNRIALHFIVAHQRQRHY